MSIPPFSLVPTTCLLDTLGSPVAADSPLTMEALHQAYGFVLYTHTAATTVSGTLQPGDRARDRVLVYINDRQVGVIDSQYQHPPAVNISLKARDKLSLLVENLGQVDYYSRGNI